MILGDDNPSRKAILALPADHPRRLVRNKDYMHDLYNVQKFSTTEIAQRLCLSNTTVNTGLKQCNIKLRSKSDAIRGKARPNACGPKHRDWKGGISGWRKLARGRLNESFVRPIMERDGFVCRWCFSKNMLVVHHDKRSFMEIVNIIRLSFNELDVEDFVNAIVREHTLNDGITLCKICHDSFHKRHGK